MPPIARKKQASPHTRTRIVVEHENGSSLRSLGRKYTLAKSTIAGIVTRYGNQQSAKDNPRSGRPPLLSERDKRHILILIAQNPFISCPQIKTEANIDCCSATILRFLRKEGIAHYKALRRPKLSVEAARKRLEFAQEHINKPQAFWESCIFTDETTVTRGEGERQK
jgi:transposase